MSARSAARFTLASHTPGTASIARSTRPTQEAQFMPSIGNVSDRGNPGPAFMARLPLTTQF
jgi:hypothetical protein